MVVMNALQTALQPLVKIASFQWMRRTPEMVVSRPEEIWGSADHQARAKRAAQYTAPQRGSHCASTFQPYTAPPSAAKPAHELLRTPTPLNPRPLNVRAHRYTINTEWGVRLYDTWVWERERTAQRSR